jgi:uncharacterized protein (TIGR02145 family)
VREGPKEAATVVAAKFVTRVDVVPTRRVVVPAGQAEIGGLRFVDMGAQRRTAQNVELVEYNDGMAIREVSSTGEYVTPSIEGEGVWLYLDFNSGRFEIGDKNRLYTMGVRGQICPAGWRMPTEEDWMALIAFVRAELKKRSGKETVTDAEVWAELRDGEFKAVMTGYMDWMGVVNGVIDDPVTGRGRTTSTAWMVAEGGGGEAGRGAIVIYGEEKAGFRLMRDVQCAASIRLIAE